MTGRADTSWDPSGPVAGGGFRHRRYAADDPEDNTPLANLFVTIAQQLEIEIDRFGSNTADSVDGLEVV